MTAHDVGVRGLAVEVALAVADDAARRPAVVELAAACSAGAARSTGRRRGRAGRARPIDDVAGSARTTRARAAGAPAIVASRERPPNGWSWQSVVSAVTSAPPGQRFSRRSTEKPSSLGDLQVRGVVEDREVRGDARAPRSPTGRLRQPRGLDGAAQLLRQRDPHRVRHARVQRELEHVRPVGAVDRAHGRRRGDRRALRAEVDHRRRR